MSNGRCRLHGGKSSGPPLGSQNARTHGIYVSGLTADEQELAATIQPGSVDEELLLCRIQLRRAVIAQQAWEARPQTEAVPLVEIEEGTLDGKAGALIVKKRTRRAPDFDAIIHRLTGRIGELERIRKELNERERDHGALTLELHATLERIAEVMRVPADEEEAEN